METALLSAGIACLIAAIVGGGLKAFGIEIPLLQSLTRQLLLGTLGVLLLVLSFTTSTPAPNGKTSPTPIPTRTASPRPTRVIPPATGGQLHLSVNNNPRVVPAGGQTTILVRVTDRTGTVVAGAMVRISAGGGSFAATGVTNADGLTDAQGLFRTNWHTYEARAYTGNMSYEMKIEATREGYEKGETSFTVPVSLQ